MKSQTCVTPVLAEKEAPVIGMVTTFCALADLVLQGKHVRYCVFVFDWPVENFLCLLKNILSKGTFINRF